MNDRQAPQEDDRGAARPVADDRQAAPVTTAPQRPTAPERRPEAAEEQAVAVVLPAAESRPDARHEKAAALLTALRCTDDRLTLTRRDVNRLAPAVTAWFDCGVPAAVVHRALTADLPADMRRPAGVLDYRLRELLPAPLPAIVAPRAVPADVRAGHRPHPFQTCDGCERAFRAPEPGRCRDCRPDRPAALSAARAA